MKIETPHTFAEALRRVRREQKLTMLDAAERTGISLPIYKMIEYGKIFPDREKLTALCAVFPCLCDYAHQDRTLKP